MNDIYLDPLKPETPLPWDEIPNLYDSDIGISPGYQNERFILHACNAYPRLIELLRTGRYKHLGEAEKLLKELGEL
jgi:hypothetical protein